MYNNTIDLWFDTSSRYPKEYSFLVLVHAFFDIYVDNS